MRNIFHELNIQYIYILFNIIQKNIKLIVLGAVQKSRGVYFSEKGSKKEGKKNEKRHFGEKYKNEGNAKTSIRLQIL